MASFSSLSSIIPLFLLLPLFASARPCKTLLISSFSYSLPSSSPNNPSLQIHTSYFRVFLSNPDPYHHHHHLHSLPALPRHVSADRPSFGSLPFGSFRERARDIMAVVVALLFGVGCGALTSATLYLVWSLLSGSPSVEEQEYEELVESPKKMGYDTIPAAETVAVGKDGYEGKN